MSILDGVRQALSNTKPTSQEVGLGGFRLFAKTSESTKYSSNVPVDVLEDGSTSTDDILRNPITVTIDGDIGDIFVEPRQYPTLIGKDFSQLGEVTEFLPARTQQLEQRISQIDSQIRDAAIQVDRVERIGGNVYEFFSGAGSNAKTPQEKFIEFMEGIYYGQQPINISTQYRFYESMGLADLTTDLNNETGQLSFTAQFTRVEYTTLQYIAVPDSIANPSKSVSAKSGSNQNKGGQNVDSNTPRSFLSSIAGALD